MTPSRRCDRFYPERARGGSRGPTGSLRGWHLRRADLGELASFRVWDDLVNDAGLPPDRYVEIITATALATLSASSKPATVGRDE
jgi:hypothetical protein